SLASQITFTNAITRLSGNTTFHVAGSMVSGVAVNDPGVCGGTDSIGTIRLEGVFNSPSFTVIFNDCCDGIRLQLGGIAAANDCSNCPPTILSQPLSQIAQAGGLASFYVLVSGTLPLAYQWRKDGVSIDGATNAGFTIANAQTNDAGSY